MIRKGWRGGNCNEMEAKKEKELDKLEDAFLFPPSINWRLDFSD